MAFLTVEDLLGTVEMRGISARSREMAGNA